MDEHQIRSWMNHFRVMVTEERSSEDIENWVRTLHMKHGPRFVRHEKCVNELSLFNWDPETMPLKIDYAFVCEGCSK